MAAPLSHEPDEATCARHGAIAAAAAKASPPRCRRQEDVLKLTRLIQSRGCFFSCFSNEVLEEICQNLQYRPMLSKKILYNEGAESNYIYLVATGKISLRDTKRGSKAPVVGTDGSDIILGAEPIAARTTHKSRSARKRDATLQLFREITEEVAEVEQQTPIQRFRAAVFAMRTSLPGKRISGSGDGLSAPSSSSKSKKPRKSWTPVADALAGSSPIRGTPHHLGRLTAPFSQMLEEMAARSVSAKRSVPKLPFNDEFNSFSARIDAELEKVLRAPEQLRAPAQPAPPPEPKSFEPFVDANPLNRGIDFKAFNKAADEKPDTPQPVCRDKQHVEAAAREAPTTSIVGPGHAIGVNACMSKMPYDTSALCVEKCELLALAADDLHVAVEMEQRIRRQGRQSSLVTTVPSLRAIEGEKMERLMKCFRSSCHRRGTVLCWEGETRDPSDPDDRVQFIVAGAANAYKARAEGPPANALTGAPRRDNSPAQRNVGTVIPGQIINGASQFLGLPEPLTVIVDSAEATVVSIMHADLVRFGGQSLLDSLKNAVQELHTWREQRLGSDDGGYSNGKTNVSLGAKGEMTNLEDNELYTTTTHDRLSTWVADDRPQSPSVALPQLSATSITLPESIVDHDGTSRNEILRGGPEVQGKRRFPVPPPRCGAAISETSMSSVRNQQQGMSEDFRPRFLGTGSIGMVSTNLNPAEQEQRLANLMMLSDRLALQHAMSQVREFETTRPLSDALMWPSPFNTDNTWFKDNALNCDHFSRTPRLSPLVSQLYHGEDAMRYTLQPRCDRMEMHGCHIVMQEGPIDPLHIAALHSQSRAKASFASTAPAKVFRANGPASQTDSSPSPRAKPSTAPLPQLPPLTPNVPSMPPPPRWRGKESVQSVQSARTSLKSSRPRTTPTDSRSQYRHNRRNNPSQASVRSSQSRRNSGSSASVAALVMEDSIDRERQVSELLSEDSIRNSLKLTIASTARGGRSIVQEAVMDEGRHAMEQENTVGQDEPLRSEADEQLPLLPSMQASSIDFATDTMEHSQSLDVADLLNAGASLANVSTMVDEESIWDHMWSAIGSVPSDSVVLSERVLSQDEEVEPAQGSTEEEKEDLVKTTFCAWPSHRPKGSALWNRYAAVRSGVLEKGVPDISARRHKAMRPKALEAKAKSALGESTPLHVHSIDHFLERPEW